MATLVIFAFNAAVLYYDIVILIYYQSGILLKTSYHAITAINRDPHCLLLIKANIVALTATSLMLAFKKKRR
jgi:hypothetical protein